MKPSNARYRYLIDVLFPIKISVESDGTRLRSGGTRWNSVICGEKADKISMARWKNRNVCRWRKSTIERNRIREKRAARSRLWFRTRHAFQRDRIRFFLLSLFSRPLFFPPSPIPWSSSSPPSLLALFWPRQRLSKFQLIDLAIHHQDSDKRTDRTHRKLGNTHENLFPESA